ncbi:MAG: SDR family NAD(P)-dependent oxidoreductase [Myxococcaceae bacterium]
MDLKGKVVVVTGATSGLGQAFAVDVSKSGAKVFLIGRDEKRAQETKAQCAPDAEVIIGDVSTRAGVHALAEKILAKTDKIDVLVNNAGGQWKEQSKTADGIETTFAVNTVSAFLLEKQLHGALSKAKGRVVNLVTGFLNNFPVVPDQLVSPTQYKSLAIYGRAKHAGVMMTVEQAKRFATDGVTAQALHPGIILGTRFGGGQPALMQAIAGPIMRGIGMACTLDEAVRRFKVAAFDPIPNGSYVVNGKPTKLPKQSEDAAVRAKVMSILDGFASA